MDLIGKIIGVRLKEELIDILKEERFAEALFRLRQLKVLAFVHPGIKLTESKRRLFLQIRAAAEAAGFEKEPPKAWIIRLAILMLDIKPAPLKNWVEAMKFRKNEIEVICTSVRAAGDKRLRAFLNGSPKRSELYFKLKEYPEEVLLFLAALMPDKGRQAVILYLKELRHVKTSLNGKRLLELGFENGPGIGKALYRIKKAKLDERVVDESDELKIVRSLLAGAKR